MLIGRLEPLCKLCGRLRNFVDSLQAVLEQELAPLAEQRDAKRTSTSW